jgi:DNA invertase Pin-like site-specific DNA recombinase
MGGRKAGADNVHADRDQIDEIERHAAALGATVTILAPELNVSGGLPLERRPSLLAAIEGVEAGRYDAICVAYLSRLGRNTREQLKAWDRVEAAGGRIIVIRENIDSSTAAGRMHRGILLAIVEHEREQHAERFERLRVWATAAGVWQRRQTPLGYVRDRMTRRLVPSRDADRVRAAFMDRIAGKPVSVIARDLQMTPSGVRALLRNRVYLGELRVGEHVNPAAHPPIIQVDVWHAAQAARVTRPPRVARHPALLAGVARCAGCGHALARGRGKVEVYSCAGQHSDGPCPAPAAVTLSLLDAHVEAIVLARLAALHPRGPVDDKPLRDATAARKAAEGELAVFLRDVRAAGLKAGQFAEGARDRADAIDRARHAEERLLAGRVGGMITGDAVEAWGRMNATQRNHVLGRVVEVVLVARAGGRGSRTPLADRVRVIRYGAGVVDAKRYRGEARPIVTVGLPDVDDPRVLGVHLSQDEL